jgi:hypothetical protein
LPELRATPAAKQLLGVATMLGNHVAVLKRGTIERLVEQASHLMRDCSVIGKRRNKGEPEVGKR